MTKLRIAKELTLPVDAVTQAIGILAKRRAGKSYTARRFAEQLFGAGQQIVIVDPKGDWWGIRSSADGKSPGLPVVILGGERGDVPLEVGAGEVVAKLVTEERVSVLLDLSLFRKHEVTTFMTAFLENLYRLKAREVNRTPLMLFIDEADAIAPQKPQENQARMLGAAEDIVRRGGQRGIGCTLITQRSAVLNKNVLTQVEMIVALRTIAPQDLKAMDAWVEVHGEKEQRDTLMTSLPALPIGDAWFWSPGWPTAEGIFQHVHVLPIDTFDSGATPKSGEKRVEPKNLADVDLDKLTRQMAATIEKAKADDPRELRKQITQLRTQLTVAQKAGGTIERTIVDQAAIDRAVERALTDERRRTRRVFAELQKSLLTSSRMAEAIPNRLVADLADIEKHLSNENNAKPGALLAPKEHGRNPASSVVSQSGNGPERRSVGHAGGDSRERPASSSLNGSVSGVQQRILNTLQGFASLGIEEPDKATVAALVGYHPNAKSYSNAIGALRTSGYIEYPTGGRIRLTSEGSAIAEDQLAVSSVDELHRVWFDKLGNVAQRILKPLLDAYPDSVEADVIAGNAGYHPNAKSFSNMKGRLRTLGLIDYPRPGMMAATSVLFPAGLS